MIGLDRPDDILVESFPMSDFTDQQTRYIDGESSLHARIDEYVRRIKIAHGKIVERYPAQRHACFRKEFGLKDVWYTVGRIQAPAYV